MPFFHKLLSGVRILRVGTVCTYPNYYSYCDDEFSLHTSIDILLNYLWLESTKVSKYLLYTKIM